MITFLTFEDIALLTGKVRPAAQRRALDKMEVPYNVRPDGRPVVARDAVGVGKGEKAPAGPNWGALQ